MIRKVIRAGKQLRITIPNEVVKVLGIEEGDYLEVPESAIKVIKKKDVKL